MRLLIVQPNRDAVSETFIRAHAERLPADVTVVHGTLPQIGTRPVLGGSWGTLATLGHGWLRGIRPRSGWGDWAMSCGYWAALGRCRPDAVLAEYGTFAAKLVDACRRRRVPLIAHFHGVDASHRPTLDEYSTAYRELFAFAAAIVAVSRAMHERLLSLGAPPDRLHYNPYGVDAREFQGADPAAAPPCFLAVGRFVEKKAPHLTLLAFARVRAICPEAKLRMIGTGPLFGVCRDLATTLGLDDVVTFLGAQSPDVVRAEMRRARAFVQHSVEASDGDSEGTPVAVLEAGASGLPVVATRHAGIPDFVEDGRTGLLTAERDVAGMAAAIVRLCREPGTAAALGANARRHVCENFSMERSIARLWDILQQAVKAAKA